MSARNALALLLSSTKPKRNARPVLSIRPGTISLRAVLGRAITVPLTNSGILLVRSAKLSLLAMEMKCSIRLLENVRVNSRLDRLECALLTLPTGTNRTSTVRNARSALPSGMKTPKNARLALPTQSMTFQQGSVNRMSPVLQVHFTIPRLANAKLSIVPKISLFSTPRR
jgi:hypothetical protein